MKENISVVSKKLKSAYKMLYTTTKYSSISLDLWDSEWRKIS